MSKTQPPAQHVAEPAQIEEGSSELAPVEITVPSADPSSRNWILPPP